MAEQGSADLIWVMLLDLDHACGTAGLDLVHPLHHLAGKREKRLRMRRIFALKYRGRAGIASLANFGIEFHAAQKRYVELFRSLLRAAAREDINFVLAMRADKVTHVLDHAHDIHLHLTEHLDGFASI